MKSLKPDIDIDLFFEKLRNAKRAILILDYDGTLAPFNIDPSRAYPYPDVPPLLDKLNQLTNHRLVIVSGRWTQDLIPLLGMKKSPEIWGSHGWEHISSRGEYKIAKIDESVLRRLVETDAWTQELQTLGARIEMKPASVAIHWRGLMQNKIEHIRSAVRDRWQLDKADEYLEWHDFDGGIELRAPGRNKGHAISDILASESDDFICAYLGDDQTDEDAFKALNSRGLAVLVRSEFRKTEADIWLRPPFELMEFLERWYHVRKSLL